MVINNTRPNNNNTLLHAACAIQVSKIATDYYINLIIIQGVHLGIIQTRVNCGMSRIKRFQRSVNEVII